MESLSVGRVGKVCLLRRLSWLVEDDQTQFDSLKISRRSSKHLSWRGSGNERQGGDGDGTRESHCADKDSREVLR